MRSCNDEIGPADDLDLFLHGRYHGDKGYLIEKKYGQMLENIGIWNILFGLANRGACLPGHNICQKNTYLWYLWEDSDQKGNYFPKSKLCSDAITF